jgi:two-component system OmpR family response regulator
MHRPGADEVMTVAERTASGGPAEPAADAVRVLVVDDEPAIADLVGTALRYEGFDVATAGSGRDVLTMVESFRPELIVLDIMLPDLDGFEVQRRLADRGRRIPVLFLTARDATEDKVRGLTIGGDDYVTKPFSLEELIARIRAVVRRGGAAGAAVHRQP